MTEYLHCECGERTPCKYHDVSDEMRRAYRALLTLEPEQRTRIFCWFCPTCGMHSPADSKPHYCAG